jgi:RNA polymerase sigma-70 factor (ECF subfamily)
VDATDGLVKCADEELLIRARHGKRDAFATLVRRYERELYGYLRRYLGDAALADDVFQNTFLQVYVKMSSYEAGRPVRPWLYTIATHQAIDALRRSGRHQAVSLSQRPTDVLPGEPDDLSCALECKGPGPLEAADTEERRRAVRAAVDRLPDFLRQVVVLGYYQGLKYREIADILDIPLGTVKSRLHAALQKLQEHWLTDDVAGPAVSCEGS